MSDHRFVVYSIHIHHFIASENYPLRSTHPAIDHWLGLKPFTPIPCYGEPFKVVGLCSGTLLSAIYKEIDVLHSIESESLRIDDLRYLIEEGIWGFDVLHHAVHLQLCFT